MNIRFLIAISLFCFAASWLFAAEEKASPPADKPAASQTQDVKEQKAESKLNGRWEGKFTRPDGEEIKILYAFKVDGEKLTGTVESPRGERTITNGKVKGDELSFEVEA